MTKTIAVFMGIMLMAVTAFANQELIKEGNDLLAQKQQLVQQINKIEVRLIEIQGVIKWQAQQAKKIEKEIVDEKTDKSTDKKD